MATALPWFNHDVKATQLAKHAFPSAICAHVDISWLSGVLKQVASLLKSPAADDAGLVVCQRGLAC
jgi:hypothetical protein